MAQEHDPAKAMGEPGDGGGEVSQGPNSFGDTETEFTFAAHDGKTLMTMVQRGFPSVELRDEHQVGLPNAVARFERSAGRPTT